MQADPELEAIRQRRMQELMARHGTVIFNTFTNISFVFSSKRDLHFVSHFAPNLITRGSRGISRIQSKRMHRKMLKGVSRCALVERNRTSFNLEFYF